MSASHAGPAAAARRVALLLVASAALPAAAWDNDAGLWFTLQLATPLSTHADASLILQPRFDHDIGRLERLVVRPALHWNASPGLTLTQGYDAHIIDAPRDRIEHRLWQEVAARRALGERLDLLYQLRLEERFIEDVEGVALRPRLLVGGVYRLSEDWSTRVTNEVFLNANDPDDFSHSAFDQNRTIAALVRQLGPGRSALAGYQLQLLNTRTGDRAIHQVFLGFSQRL